MPPILKPIAVILLAVPLLAQSPIVARRINPYPNFIPEDRPMASGYLLHVGERSEPLRAGLQSLPSSEELAEMNIKFESIAENAPLYSQLAKEIGLLPGSKWALTDADGRLVAQGTEAPKAADLRKAMDGAGVKSPIQRLREFLKVNPSNLDARLDLLNMLLETAEAATKKVLQLGVPLPAAARRRTRNSTSASLIFDLAPLDGKTLDSAEDAKIWGPYAAELDALFTNGDWRLLKLPDSTNAPLEAASPKMAQLYRRHLPKIESALEENPRSDDLWQVYSLARAVAGRGSVRTLVERLVPGPWEEGSWPNDNVFALLMSEEMAKGNWGTVAQEHWSRWPALKNVAREKVEFLKELNAGANVQESTTKAMIASEVAPLMKDNFAPLVESLLKAGRVQDAETVLTDIARLPDYRGFQRMAADAALKCGREDLSQKWLALEIPIKDKPDKDDFDLMVKFLGRYIPVLVVANWKQNQERRDAMQEVEVMLKQGPLFDWNLSYTILNQEMSEIMNRSYGLPDKETNWLLVGANGKTVASGSGRPTPEVLNRALVHSAIPTEVDVLRRFAMAHPSHYDAKNSFLHELLRLAKQKTKDKLGAGAGKDRTLMLSAEDDEAIWGEYANAFSQVLSYQLEKSGAGGNLFSMFFIHSPKMRALAALQLPRVEDALKRQPLNQYLWGYWFYFAPFSEKARFKTFRESLAIPPMRRQLESPPNFSLWSHWATLNIFDQAPADLQVKIDVFSWVMEAWRPIFEKEPATMAFGVWNNVGNPLMEAYLLMDKDSDASALADWWRESPNWDRIKPDMVGLAKEYGKDELAERWGKL